MLEERKHDRLEIWDRHGVLDESVGSIEPSYSCLPRDADFSLCAAFSAAGEAWAALSSGYFFSGPNSDREKPP
jgi:hypothetical protein